MRQPGGSFFLPQVTWHVSAQYNNVTSSFKRIWHKTYKCQFPSQCKNCSIICAGGHWSPRSTSSLKIRDLFFFNKSTHWLNRMEHWHSIKSKQPLVNNLNRQKPLCVPGVLLGPWTTISVLCWNHKFIGVTSLTFFRVDSKQLSTSCFLLQEQSQRFISQSDAVKAGVELNCTGGQNSKHTLGHGPNRLNIYWTHYNNVLWT